MLYNITFTVSDDPPQTVLWESDKYDEEEVKEEFETRHEHRKVTRVSRT